MKTPVTYLGHYDPVSTLSLNDTSTYASITALTTDVRKRLLSAGEWDRPPTIQVRNPWVNTHRQHLLTALDDTGAWHSDVLGDGAQWLFLWSNVGPTQVLVGATAVIIPPPGTVVLLDNNRVVHRAVFTPEEATDRWFFRATVYGKMNNRRIRKLKEAFSA